MQRTISENKRDEILHVLLLAIRDTSLTIYILSLPLFIVKFVHSIVFSKILLDMSVRPKLRCVKEFVFKILLARLSTFTRICVNEELIAKRSDDR